MTDRIGVFASANPWPTAVVAVVLGLAVVALLVRAGRAGAEAFRERRREGRVTVAQVVATVGALVTTGVGANTAWRFAGSHLHVTNVWERGSLFLAGEVMLFGLALMARQNLHNPSMRRTGLPGTLVWVLSGFLAVPAIAESNGSFAGAAWRIVLVPLGAALLWHLAMGIELRQSDGEAQNRGFLAVLLRRVQQLLLSWLGVSQDLDAQEIARNRALVRAAALAEKYAALCPSERKKEGWRARRVARRLQRKLRAAGVATDAEQRARLMAYRAVSQHARGLARITLDSPWELPAVVPAAPGPQGAPFPASRAVLPVGDVDEEWRRLTAAAAGTVSGTGEGGPDDDGPGGPDGPGGGAPEPAGAEAVAAATVWAELGDQEQPEADPEPALTAEDLERLQHTEVLRHLETHADAIRYAIAQTGSTVAGELVRWLALHGREGVNAGQAYKVAQRHVQRQRETNIRPLRPTQGS
jgi:hypothetical protein